MILPFRASLAAALVLAASAVQAAAPAAPSSAVVPIKSFAFMPMTVTIAAGGSVTWKNLDGEPHTVTSLDGAFRSGALDQNDSYSFRFTKPGVYRYLCTIHPRMVATVTVK